MRRHSSLGLSASLHVRALQRASTSAATALSVLMLLFLAACGGGDEGSVAASTPGASTSAGMPDAGARDDVTRLEATTTTWTHVASEWQTFVLVQPSRVRYGAGTTWIERDLPAGQATCSNAFFGTDPLQGVAKSCETLQAVITDWTFLADEWQAFTLAVPTRVRYGAGRTWVERDLPAGQANCSNTFFGSDPVPGVVKHCESQGASPTGTWTFVADEWGAFTLSAASRVRYGAGSTWVERDLPAGQASCSNAYFGADPLPGTVKRCEARQGGGGGGGGGDRPTDRAQAARFLTQATFGPTNTDIDRLMAIGYAA